MLFTVVKGPTYIEAKAAIQQVKDQVDGIEFRLDCFEKIDLDEILQLLKMVQGSTLFTLRKKAQGGFFEGSEAEREALISKLFFLKPSLFDLEYDMRKEFIEKMANEHPETKILISYHDFEKTPESLQSILQSMQNPHAYAYKIATMAHSSLDAIRMLCFIKETVQSGIKFCGITMGEDGTPARILGKTVKNFIDYASLDKERESAPGQIDIYTMLTQYCYHSLASSTAIYGLIGDPVQASLGDIVHNAVIRENNIDAVYVKMRIPKKEIDPFFRLANSLNIQGLSVTMPLKEEVFPFLNEIDMEAQKIGAVNTIVKIKDKFCGYNTDGKGALDALEAKGSISGKKVIIIGAGGAAKAIAYEAIKRGGECVIVNRTEDKARDLSTQLGCRFAKLASISEEYKRADDILIKCIPEAMPFDAELFIPGRIVMDIVTVPKESVFLKKAIEKGCVPVYGYEMFVNQAALQCAYWFQGIQLSSAKEIINKKCLEILDNGQKHSF